MWISSMDCHRGFCHILSELLSNILDSGCFNPGYENCNGKDHFSVIGLPKWYLSRFILPLIMISNNNEVDGDIFSFYRLSSAWFWVPIIEAVKDRAVKGRSAITIKSHWLRCRYDPEYEMCRQLVWGNYIRLKEEFQN